MPTGVGVVKETPLLLSHVFCRGRYESGGQRESWWERAAAVTFDPAGNTRGRISRARNCLG